ncbi:MAG TPA: response regulator FixJ [Caulobacteraceae bacterium]|jgi:two-component system response regulator FixJ
MPDPQAHVIDDDDEARASLAFLLSAAGVPARTYPSAAAFLEVATTAAGVVITDVRMPEIDGMQLVRRLAELNASLPVIVMTGHGDVPLAVAAMKAGALDFIEKPYDDETMLAAIRAALARHGENLARDAERALFLRRIDGLTARERQVLEGLVAGKANKVIARDLRISPRTVEIYRAHVMAKMEAQSLSELVRMALVAGADLQAGGPTP